MEEGRHKEETKYEERNIVTCHPPLSPNKPHTLLMITDEKNCSGKNGGERHMFYSFTEDHNFVRLVQELEDKNVACCYGGWLILSDTSTYDCSILNILTMEKLELPPLPSEFCTDFVMSSPVTDRSCRVILIERDTCTNICTFWSCHLGDTEFTKKMPHIYKGISDHIIFKGKLYALTARLNLVAFNFSDPNLECELVISGDSLLYLSSIRGKKNYLVESCEDLLLISIGSYSFEVSDVQLFKAEFSTREWVEMKTLGDRTIFLGSRSSPATTLGMKGNAIYWITTPSSKSPERRLYMYDVEDKSISMSLLDLIVPSLFAVSFPMTCNEDKRSQQKATTKSSMLQIEQRKTEETKTITFREDSLLEDLPTELLQEISSHLFAGDSVAFRSVCRSWYSLSPPFRTVPPLKSSLGLSSPLLMCPNYPIYGMDFPPGAKVRATRDGWLLMDSYSAELFFFNPFTKREILLPLQGAKQYFSMCFSAPPTSTDCLVLLIFPPKKKCKIHVTEAPKFFDECKFKCEQQYMLESDDDKLIRVFLGEAGSLVYTCHWNDCTKKWEILGSLGNIMLFVSRPLSFCKRATVSGTGNKIYFPRLVSDGQILFYSLATKRYHTFEMGTSYSNFSGSKYYPEYNGWFMP